MRRESSVSGVVSRVMRRYVGRGGGGGGGGAVEDSSAPSPPLSWVTSEDCLGASAETSAAKAGGLPCMSFRVYSRVYRFRV